MPLQRLAFFCFTFALIARAPAAERVSEPSAQQVLSVMERVADWQLAHPAQHRPDGYWAEAVGWIGIAALSEISPSDRYVEAMKNCGAGNDWKLGSRLYSADDQCIGQMYLTLFLRTRESAEIAGLEKSFDEILRQPKDDDLDFTHPDALNKWSWCDSLFMAPPAWVRLYAVTGHEAYLDYAIEHWWKTSDFLYDRSEHLFYRDSRAFVQREANGQKIFWSRGNGWVIAGLARTLQVLPLAHPQRPRFEAQFREMAARLAQLQQPDGLWRSSLLDPTNFPMQETSGSGLHCFAIAWGINHGLLDRTTFEPTVLRAWSALVAQVKPDGKLTHVQPIGFAPKTFDPEWTDNFGVGAFLLAGSEVYRLAGGRAVADFMY